MALAAEQAAPEVAPEPTELRRLIEETDRFLFAAEMGTSRGLITDERAAGPTEIAREVADSGQIDFICTPDNPFGSAHNRPEILGADLLSRVRKWSSTSPARTATETGLRADCGHWAAPGSATS